MKGKKRKGKVPPHLRPYLFKKGKKRSGKKSKRKSTHHKEGHVAKSSKKRKSKKSGGTKRRGGGARRRSHHRRHGGGGDGGGVSMPVVVAGGAIGWLEHQMKTDATFIANKVPTPLAPLGRLGNLVGLAWLANKFFGKHLPAVVRKGIGYGVKAGAPIVAYQVVRKHLSGQPFKEGTEVFTIAGVPYDRRVEEQLDGDDMGALEEEVGRHARIDVEWDEHEHEDAPLHHDDAPRMQDSHIPAGESG